MGEEELNKRIKNLEDIYANAVQSNVSDRFLDKLMNDLQYLRLKKEELSESFNVENVEKKSQQN